MNVQFANTVVPIWKLRIGTVVSYTVLGHVCYVHIVALSATEGNGNIFVTIESGASKYTVKPEQLTWLEPF
jgi:hypothetical protein